MSKQYRFGLDQFIAKTIEELNSRKEAWLKQVIEKLVQENDDVRFPEDFVLVMWEDRHEELRCKNELVATFTVKYED